MSGQTVPEGTGPECMVCGSQDRDADSMEELRPLLLMIDEKDREQYVVCKEFCHDILLGHLMMMLAKLRNGEEARMMYASYQEARKQENEEFDA